MFSQHDLGASLFKTWSKSQQQEEITKLVEGYRNGLPIGVLCKMAETICGSRRQAAKYLRKMLTAEERRNAIAGETGGMHQIVKEFLED